MLLADFDQRVRWIYAQPFRLVARVDGRVRSHVPDLLLVTAAETGWLVNVKLAAWLADPKIVEALAWPGVLAQRHGWEYEIWSGTNTTVVENVRFLAGYRRPGIVPAGEVERVWAGVRDGEQLAEAELRLAGDRPRYEVRPALLALLWSGRLIVIAGQRRSYVQKNWTWTAMLVSWQLRERRFGRLSVRVSSVP